MRDLKHRLAQFDRAKDKKPKPSMPADAEPLAALLKAGARWVGESPTGYLLRESPVSRDHLVPRRTLGDATWRRMGAEPPNGPRWAVLDTETTGLESGTGTMVFLVGLLIWTPGRMRRLQYFLPEPAGEARMLADVAEEISRADGLLSYNGRCFDLGRMRSRMRLQRFDDSVFERPHLDLLFPARRIARDWLSDARLPTLEKQWLGLDREGDLPGSFAPQVYLDLQVDHRDTGLVDVLEHNARDIDRLPALAHWLSLRYAGTELDAIPPVSLLSLARALEDRQSAPEALRCLEKVVATGQDADRIEAYRAMGRLRRRDGDCQAAAEILEEGLAAHDRSVAILVDLAKLYEHRLSDPARATELVRSAQGLQRERRALGNLVISDEEHAPRQLGRRLKRLMRKTERTSHAR